MLLSVVVGSKNNRATLTACLESLQTQAAGRAVELIVADASTDGSGELVANQFPEVKLVSADPSTLVPVLWQLGYDVSEGEIVAFTIGQCVPAGDWIDTIIQAHEQDIVGIGGPIDGPDSRATLDWGLYFSRYSAFLPAGKAGSIHEIAGDNAAYKRSALELCHEEIADGFWETLAHAKLRAEGHALYWEPRMIVQLGDAGRWQDLVSVRFRHGRHYAATRPGNTPITRLLRAIAGPLLIPVLLLRIRGRVKASRPDWQANLLRGLSGLLLIVTAWSLGETVGYLTAQP